MGRTITGFFSRGFAVCLVLISGLGLYAVLVASERNPDPLITGLIFFGFQLFALLSSFSRVGEQIRSKGNKQNGLTNNYSLPEFYLAIEVNGKSGMRIAGFTRYFGPPTYRN